MCSKSCLMRILYKMQKTNRDVLVSDSFIGFLNLKSLKPSWNSFTTTGWPGDFCESMELSSRIVGLSIMKKRWHWVLQAMHWDSICFHLGGIFGGRYWRGGSGAGPHGCIPLVLSKPLHQSPSTLHCTHAREGGTSEYQPNLSIMLRQLKEDVRCQHLPSRSLMLNTVSSQLGYYFCMSCRELNPPQF